MDLRRSTRKTTLVYKAPLNDPAGDCHEYDAYKETKRKPPKKHQKTTMVTQGKAEGRGNNVPAHWRHVRGRRGALKQLVEMPLDILFEIFKQLGPADVLNLSQMNKALRNILTKRSVAFIWKRACNNVDLPDCPRDLNEMQYVKLLFQTVCKYCSAVNAQNIVWSIYIRACRGCVRDPTKFENYMTGFTAILLLDPVEINVSRNGYTYRQPRYCRRARDRFAEEYEALSNDVFDNSRKEWQTKTQELISYRSGVGRRCNAWIRDRAQERAAIIESIRENRYTAVKAKLAEAGWGEEVDKLPTGPNNDSLLKRHKAVWQPKPLTDRIWENIKPAIIELMEDCKAERLEKEFRAIRETRRGILEDLYYGYAASLPLHTIIPGLADVAQVPEFEALINAPAEETVTPQLSKATMLKLSRITMEWRQSRIDDLLGLVRVDGIEAVEADLNRPLIRFACNLCRQSLEYPRVLVHHCMTSLHQSTKDHPDREVIDDLRCRPWNQIQALSFQKTFYQCATAILQKCGFNADTVTSEDVEENSVFFECLTCDDPVKGRAVLTWNYAVSHLMSWPSHDISRAELSDEEQQLVQVILAEKQAHSRSLLAANEQEPRWLCVRCRRRYGLFDMGRHIVQEHNKRTHVENEDYVLHLDGLAPANRFDSIMRVKKDVTDTGLCDVMG